MFDARRLLLIGLLTVVAVSWANARVRGTARDAEARGPPELDTEVRGTGLDTEVRGTGLDTEVRSTGKIESSDDGSQKKAPSAAEDATDLRELIDEIKRYIHREESPVAEKAADKAPAQTAPSAHEDARTVYAAGTSEDDVESAVADGRGYWTEWIDADPDPTTGLGEFEDCAEIKWKQNREGRCFLGCRTPVAARYSVHDPNIKATWTEIEDCIGPMDSTRVSSCGFTCLNEDAKKFPKTNCDTARCVPYGLGEGCVQCPDVRVQFFCMGEQPDANRCCPYSSQCMAFKNDFKADVKALEGTARRRDFIAGVLADMKKVLEEEEQTGK